MAIPKFEENVNIISQLPNYPGSEGGLTPEEFRSRFDEAARLIKDYLNNTLTPELDKLVDVQALLDGILDETLTASNKAARADAVGEALKKKLSLSGGDMTGAMTVLDPESDKNPTTKQYVDRIVDNTYMKAEVHLTADGWHGDGPYTQTIAVSGILVTDMPHYSVAYSADQETRLAQREAFAMVDDLETADGSVTFTCFEDKPDVNIPIQMEVNR